MKSKAKGLALLLVIIIVACVYYFGFAVREKTVTLNGYLGGEKIGLFEDEEIQKLLKKKYHIVFSYSKAGSLEMVEADQTGRDYLFPSSQVALALYKDKFGAPKKSEIIFNTPIVLYTHKAVADALEKDGYVTALSDGARGVDIARLAQEILKGTKWSDLGLPELYGSVTVATTDPVKSNSGNMFAGLLANVLSEDGVADASDVSAVIPKLKTIFERSGYMESSSADLFSQFLRTGMGAKPIMAGYESQMLEFAVEHPDDWAQIKDDIVVLYPTPTVWSSHPYIALDDAGERGIDALLDTEVQALAWSKHGFRTGVSGAGADTSQFPVNGLMSVVTQVVSMPDSKVMEEIIAALEN